MADVLAAEGFELVIGVAGRFVDTGLDDDLRLVQRNVDAGSSPHRWPPAVSASTGPTPDRRSSRGSS
jgi:hypothetical protein